MSTRLDYDELFEEASGRIGGEAVAGFTAREGRLALRLLFSDWANRGCQMWQLDEIVVPLAAATTLPADTTDVVEAFVRIDGRDRTIQRIGLTSWVDVEEKSAAGRPCSYLVERRRDAPVLRISPLPDFAGELHVWRIREATAVSSMSDLVDVPERFLASAAAGLAYQLGLKRLAKQAAEKNENLRFLIQTLKAEYEQLLLNALEADRETATIRFAVDMGGYFD
ncbi:phage adaptor protein [Aureimonas sp. AU40]|uniref:phage adaptor protein n=1 Tax=Aureimonas sp. AU40 TaxID=1637747 RepID=UPI0007864A3A|nr:hypothetical protein [Aureimonas sp. AU40]